MSSSILRSYSCKFSTKKCATKKTYIKKTEFEIHLLKLVKYFASDR